MKKNKIFDIINYKIKKGSKKPMEEKMREVRIILDNDEIVTEFDQGDMSEDEFIETVINYVLSNISVEVI